MLDHLIIGSHTTELIIGSHTTELIVDATNKYSHEYQTKAVSCHDVGSVYQFIGQESGIMQNYM